MGSMGASQIQSEMEKLEQAMVNIFGKKPAYVRPPYLETGGQFLNVMRQMNYTVINNDIDTGDWNNQSPQSSQQKFQQAGAGGNGHIPLMHETYQGTVTTLTNWLINWAKTNNLKIVTVGMFLSLSFDSPLLSLEGRGGDVRVGLLAAFADCCLMCYLAECLDDAAGMYKEGTFTGNGQSSC